MTTDRIVPAAGERTHRLGAVTLPSGVVLLLDAAATGIWSAGAPPPEADLIDLVLTGEGAAEVARRFDRDFDPGRVHDVPREEADELAAAIVVLAERSGLPMQVSRQSSRGFIERAEGAVARGGGAVSFCGSWAVVLGSMPTQTSIDVYGDEGDAGEAEGRWRRLRLVAQSEAKVVSSRPLGTVLCDAGRLLLVDLGAMSCWHERESLDGQGDVLFWGEDAAVAAQMLGAPLLEGRRYGWCDLPDDEAREKSRAVSSERESRGLRLTVEHRPHSHAWRALQAVRESPLGAGELEVGDATALSFATTWGEGEYEVFADLDTEGAVVQLRLELGSDAPVTVH